MDFFIVTITQRHAIRKPAIAPNVCITPPDHFVTFALMDFMEMPRVELKLIASIKHSLFPLHMVLLFA